MLRHGAQQGCWAAAAPIGTWRPSFGSPCRAATRPVCLPKAHLEAQVGSAPVVVDQPVLSHHRVHRPAGALRGAHAQSRVMPSVKFLQTLVSNVRACTGPLAPRVTLKDFKGFQNCLKSHHTSLPCQGPATPFACVTHGLGPCALTWLGSRSSLLTVICYSSTIFDA